MIIRNDKYCVYCHTNKIDGKKYFGQTGLIPEVRWGKNGEKYKGCPHFYHAIQKYGWDGFYHDVIASNLTIAEANNFEEIMIAEFHTQDPRFGYNIANGGSNRIPTEETRKKMSDVRKGEKNHLARSVLCDGMRFGHIGACADYYNVGRSLMNSWLVGKRPMPQIFIDMGLMCEDNQGVKYIPPKSRKRGDSPRARAVVCDGHEYQCVNDCADTYGVNFHTMFNWLSGEKRMPKKFVNMGLRFIGDNHEYTSQICGKRPVICDGVKYDTITDCAKFYNVAPNTMNRWLSGVRNMPEKFKHIGLAYYEGGDDEGC